MTDSEDEHLLDVGEEEHSVTSSSVEQMECEEVPGKQLEEDDFDGDKDIVMLPAGVKKTGESAVWYHQSSASSKYASDSVAVHMKMDSSAEMMQMTTPNSRTQRRIASFNNAKIQRHGSATTAKGNGVSGVKADGVIGVGAGAGATGVGAGVKESKPDKNAVKRTTTTKENARRAQ
ncbi:hypothetical protein BD408DRAFT_429848 [Parasitella parasitica]|nr:hypothetical protein BD408DRAFT_429848 [Parasitella parasitica]